MAVSRSASRGRRHGARQTGGRSSPRWWTASRSSLTGSCCVSERDHGVLIVRASGGDEQARDELVTALEPLVSALARRFAGRVPRADLEQAGMVGLLEALSRFDPAQGTPFESYATPFMIGEMLKTVRCATCPLRVPLALLDVVRRVAESDDELVATVGQSPPVGLHAPYVVLGDVY